jgi:hypothetical protein
LLLDRGGDVMAGDDVVFGGTRSSAVEASTGKGWLEWFEILEGAGAQKMSHQGIVAFLGDYPEVNGWWRQKITGTFEMERGGREPGQMADGFQISRSRTIPVPRAELYHAFADSGSRGAWLDREPADVRETTPGKTIWMTWVDETSQVGVSFVSKGPEKSQVTVRHTKLPDAFQAEEMKAYWSARLADLKAFLLK